MGAAGGDVGLMKLAQVAAGLVQLPFLQLGGMTLGLELGVIGPFHFHQLLHHGPELGLMDCDLQPLGDFDDAGLEAGLGRLALSDLIPVGGLDGMALGRGERAPLFVERS
jgi:hypothetical protein